MNACDRFFNAITWVQYNCGGEKRADMCSPHAVTVGDTVLVISFSMPPPTVLAGIML